MHCHMPYSGIMPRGKLGGTMRRRETRLEFLSLPDMYRTQTG